MDYKFDGNELIFVLSSLIALFTTIMLPRRFSGMQIFLQWLFVIIFIETIDFTLGVMPYNLYDFLDGPGYQPTVAIAHFILYPSAAYVFVYFYDKWHIEGFQLVAYISAWTIVSLLYEEFSVLTGILTYNHWNIFFSIPTYPIACIITLTVFKFIKNNLKKINLLP